MTERAVRLIRELWGEMGANTALWSDDEAVALFFEGAPFDEDDVEAALDDAGALADLRMILGLAY